MKKYLAIFLSFALVLCLSACAGAGITGSAQSETDSAAGGADESVTNAAAQQATGSKGSSSTAKKSGATEAGAKPADAGLKVPELSGVDVSTAKSALTSLGLIPVTVYQYSGKAAKGKVIQTSPAAGKTAAKGQKVTLSVSKGPAYQKCKSASNSFSANDFDQLYLNKPYLKNGILYIDCDSDTPMASFHWKGAEESGHGFGKASQSKSFDKSVNLTVLYEAKYASVEENQHMEFTLAIPTDKLGGTPENLYTDLYVVYSDGSEGAIPVDFTLTW